MERFDVDDPSFKSSRGKNCLKWMSSHKKTTGGLCTLLVLLIAGSILLGIGLTLLKLKDAAVWLLRFTLFEYLAPLFLCFSASRLRLHVIRSHTSSFPQ